MLPDPLCHNLVWPINNQEAEVEQTWDLPMQMTAICMAYTIFVELYEVLQIEAVKLAQKLLGVSNYSTLIAEAGNSCRQMGQSAETSQSDIEKDVLGKLSLRKLAIQWYRGRGQTIL